MPEETQYNYLKVLGQLHVESVKPHDLKGERVRVCIIMGPTGSGKSAFIEALAPEKGLSISGNSLEGITKNVVCYRVNNLQDGELPVILMDTPGLLDPRISESRVVRMISKELDMLRASLEMAVVTLCYFHAIDVARVGGKKRRAVKFLQGFAQTFKANNVNIVTTMWNNIWNEKLRKDAELRFEGLKVQIYQSLPSLNISLDRFDSTAASTLSILDAYRHGWYHTTRKQRISLPTYDTMVLQGLVERIQNIQQELDNFAKDDHQLPVIRENEDNAALLLYQFCCDLYDCDPCAYRAFFPDAQYPPITFDCQPSLSELVCYRSMSPSTVTTSVDPAIPSHSPSPKLPLMQKLSSWWMKHFGMLEVRDSDREAIKAVAEPSTSVVNLEPAQLVQAEDSQVLNMDPNLASVISQLQYLTVIGNISIEPVASEIPENAKIYILMGPLGSGKSSFVESLAGDAQRLNISNDQFASNTSTINAYYIDNVLNAGCPVIIVDTPGFHDSMISELEVMSTITAWMEQNGIHFFHQIFYLTPITDARLPGSRRRTMEMLKDLLTATHDLDSVCVISTMWDTVHDERARNNAESSFTRASSDVFKEFIDRGADITRFMNTKASALEILDRSLHKKCAFDDIAFTATPHLYRDLQHRIEGAVQEKQAIELELSQPEAKTDLNLKSTLDKNLLENERKRNKFIAQFIEYGDPPAQFAEDHQRLCELVLSLRPELLVRLSPSSVTSSDNTTPAAAGDQTNGTPLSEARKTGLVRQDGVQVVVRQRSVPNTTGIRRILGATKNRFKRLPGSTR